TDRIRAWADKKELSPQWVIVHDGVAHEVELIQRILVPFGAVGDDRAVVVGWTLLDYVSHYERQAAIRQVDGIARAPVVLIHDPVIGDEVFDCSALDVVADDGVVHIAGPQRETAHRTY